MISALGRFVEALRLEGVGASPAELLDAARAVDVVGIEDRARFKIALGATLAKNSRQREIFDRLFDRFFAPPVRLRGRRGEEAEGAAGGSRPSGTGQSATHKTPRPDKKKRSPRPAESDREALRAMLRHPDAVVDRRKGRLRSVRVRRNAEASRSRDADRDPLRRDLARPMPSEDEIRLAALIPRLIEELKLRQSRRLRRAKRGRLWARQVFRENLAHGGVPFVLPLRRPKPRRPKVVLLVDVSYSVARAAGYFLWIALEFLKATRRARVILFVDRAVDATRAVSRWAAGRRGQAPAAISRKAQFSPSRMSPARGRRGARPGAGIRPAGLPFADLLDELPGLNLGAPSDYGRAFHSLLQSQLRPGGKDAVLVILGDARTNRFDPLGWALEEISNRCRCVLWLVPEPRERWGSADSALDAYLPFVDTVVEAKDLSGLARGVAELLRRL